MERFKNHIKFIHEKRGDIEILIFSRPGGSSTDLIRYIFRNGILHISGDYGSATYEWYPDIEDLERISTFCFGYFHGKCTSSENGARNMEYDYDEAVKEMKSMIFEYLRDCEDDSAKECIRDLRREGFTLCSKHEKDAFLISEGHQILYDYGYDYDDIGRLHNLGVNPSRSSKMFLNCLKLAFNKEVKW